MSLLESCQVLLNTDRRKDHACTVKIRWDRLTHDLAYPYTKWRPAKDRQKLLFSLQSPAFSVEQAKLIHTFHNDRPRYVKNAQRRAGKESVLIIDLLWYLLCRQEGEENARRFKGWEMAVIFQLPNVSGLYFLLFIKSTFWSTEDYIHSCHCLWDFVAYLFHFKLVQQLLTGFLCPLYLLQTHKSYMNKLSKSVKAFTLFTPIHGWAPCNDSYIENQGFDRVDSLVWKIRCTYPAFSTFYILLDCPHWNSSSDS